MKGDASCKKIWIPISWNEKGEFLKIVLPFFAIPNQVDMKNVVECQKEFFAYINALET